MSCVFNITIKQQITSCGFLDQIDQNSILLLPHSSLTICQQNYILNALSAFIHISRVLPQITSPPPLAINTYFCLEESTFE